VDNYAPPTDAASRGPELNAAFPNNIWKSFDDATVNAHVGHTFANLPGDIVCAQLKIHLRPSGDFSNNDTLYLGLLPSLTGQFAFAIRLKDLPGTGGVWNPPLNPATFTLDLGSLPGSPAISLLSRLNADHRLDVLVQDDTQVDYITLTLHTFPEQTVSVGIADNFAGPTEGTSRGPQLNAAFPTALWKDLDDTHPDRFIGHTFGNLTGNVVQANLEVSLKPHSNAPDNDSLNLGLGPTSTFAFSTAIRSLPEAGGTWSTSPATTFHLDLAALPSGVNLLPKINTDDRLDILVQDDTAGDFLRLRYRTCPAPQRLAGLPHRALGEASLGQDATGAVTLSGLGNGLTPTDGARINLHDAAGFTTVLDSAGPPPDGATMISTTFGNLGDGFDRELGSVGVRREGDRFRSLIDFSPLGATGYRASFYDESGNLVRQAGLGPSDAIFIGPSPSDPPGFPKTLFGFTCSNTPNHRIWTFKKRTHKFFLDDGDIETSFLAATVVFEPIPAVPGTGTVSAVEIKASGMPELAFHEEVQPIPAVNVGSLGTAELGTSSGAVSLTDISNSGLDGLAIDLGSVDAVSASLAPIDLAGTAPAGAYLVAEARGELDGVADQPLGSLTITQVGSGGTAGFDLAASFASLGTDLQRMQIFREGSLVREEVIPAGLAARSSFWPRLLGKLGGRTECYRGKFPRDTVFTFPGESKSIVTGDEIRLLAENGAPVGSKSSFSLRVAGIDELTLTDVTVGSDAGCTPGPTNLCLNGGRFKVEAAFATPTGVRGPAQAVPLTADTGYFYFSSSTNVELVVKVLNGCSLNQRFWAFSAGLTDVEVDLKVTDTRTGEVKHYLNPLGTPYPPILDTNGFATCDTGNLAGEADAPTTANETASQLADLLASLNGGASADPAGKAAKATDLLLGQNRFRVRATFRTSQGDTGQGQAIQLTDETGYFWFFSQDNVEVVIKALNACGMNQHFWIFAAGMTDVEVVITVTDTANGTTRTYANPIGTPFVPIQDTNAFATCP
jgi:hypothetical protein